MSKDIKVTKAFQSTDRDTKEPQVVNTKGGEMHKYMVQFEGRSDWIGILKKPGNEVKAGDVLFGDIIEDGQWGKPEFKKGEKPFGAAAQGAASTTVASGDLEAKIDYLTSIVENFLEHFEGRAGTQTTTPANTDLDGEVDLSELPY